MIINLPKDLEKDTTHRYGPNSFKLHRRAALFFEVLGEGDAALTLAVCRPPTADYQRRDPARCWGW